MKKLNDFTVTDMNALAAAHPNLVTLSPNIRAIRSALKLGFKIPGVQLTDTPIEAAINENKAA